ncbi:uncharacterized protein LOC664451 [Tribolium castaneum]|uniref:uncharacterized protein LOC664451 n=1 Tax=Tribolium castaneum TaxID=7070 RepID=UPI0000D55E2D|nr:PREDICTED: uncharacterized protein LOC664451 [Tribolium castaneum]|eukprot:XP_975550.1 PREDICTED: uncharacterized protein LOC664451 [Tribolium castaneum]
MAFHIATLILLGLDAALGAVLPPPWANPKLNPCATQPGGWQLLYWPPDGKCYKIFKTGYPCSNDMELSPSPTKSGEQKFSAECRCPPMKAQSARDGKCYDLYSRGPCEKGFYFAPDTNYTDDNSKRLWGVCTQSRPCPGPNEIFWPRDGRCYHKLTKGPCPKGQLLTTDPDLIPQCRCNKHRELRDYRYSDNQCYQHFTRGPCREKGHLFLPDRTCGCHSFLPHFHDDTRLCYEIGTIGPCNSGENYQLHPETRRGTCQCKAGYVRYANTSSCFRPFTQGPCAVGEFLINSTTCIAQPCPRGHLYFLPQDKCYRIGTRGPCRKGRIVTFDFDTRPSLDGISYNGVCSCEKDVYDNNCDEEEITECSKSDGMVWYRKRCYKLYAQGPCPKGAWMAPKRYKKQELWDSEGGNEGTCECVPGYTRTIRTFRNVTEMACMPPTVILADYLNRNFSVAQIVTL